MANKDNETWENTLQVMICICAAKKKHQDNGLGTAPWYTHT